MKYAAVISLVLGLALAIVGQIEMSMSNSLLQVSRTATEIILTNQIFSTAFILSIMGMLTFVMSAVILSTVMYFDHELKGIKSNVAYVTLVTKNARKKKEKK